MTRHLAPLVLLLSGCAQTGTGSVLPSDAGLPADVRSLAVAPLAPPPLPPVEDVGGVAFVPTSAEQTWAAVALPTDTPALTQTLWVRQVHHALPDLSGSGVRLDHVDVPGLVVWHLEGPQESRADALSSLLTAIAAPALSDDGLAGALSTRPHSSDPADPVTLRALHEQTAVRARLWVSADADGRQRVEPATQSWQAGESLSDGDVWLVERAGGYIAQAACQVGNLGGSSSEDIRRTATSAVSHRVASHNEAVPSAVEAWRSGQPDVVGAMHQHIETLPLSDSPPGGCTAPERR